MVVSATSPEVERGPFRGGRGREPEKLAEGMLVFTTHDGHFGIYRAHRHFAQNQNFGSGRESKSVPRSRLRELDGRKHLQESPNRVSLKHDAAPEMLAASKTKPPGWLVQPGSLAPKGTPRSVKL